MTKTPPFLARGLAKLGQPDAWDDGPSPARQIEVYLLGLTADALGPDHPRVFHRVRDLLLAQLGDDFHMERHYINNTTVGYRTWLAREADVVILALHLPGLLRSLGLRDGAVTVRRV